MQGNTVKMFAGLRCQQVLRFYPGLYIKLIALVTRIPKHM